MILFVLRIQNFFFLLLSAQIQQHKKAQFDFVNCFLMRVIQRSFHRYHGHVVVPSSAFQELPCHYPA